MSGAGLLVFGKTGQVAQELQRLAPGADYLGRDMADLMAPAACSAQIIARKPSLVINAAAWTAVDRAETEEDAATVVNGAAPAAMAKACAAMNIPFVHISTDYVFDGAGEAPFTPDHPTAPLGAYGRSKLVGEEGVRAAGGNHAILRTSWVFSSHGNNFLKTMLRLGAARDSLTVVADQIGGPTPARGIAAACLSIAEQLAADPAKSGTYHFSGAPDVSWADFAREIMAQAGLACTITDIPTTAHPTPAHRPANSRMDCASLDVFGLERPDWKAAITNTLTDLGE
ncbi:MAG: dTDP-4-dehydrorhamnose reductase [Rhodobacteraceae bacterium]|nr:dTDP-4-dehydrorhamnose reductase [Paracoccaceae bacterium]MCF8521011.1 dTDP-4-dehydrorhamnose reductase [Paracoccaceae bacterium]